MTPIHLPSFPLPQVASAAGSAHPAEAVTRVTSSTQGLLSSLATHLRVGDADYHIGKVMSSLSETEAVLLHAALDADMPKDPLADAPDKNGLYSYLIGATDYLTSTHSPRDLNLPERMIVTCMLTPSCALAAIVISGEKDSHSYCKAHFEPPALQTHKPPEEQPKGAIAALPTELQVPGEHASQPTNLSLYMSNPGISQGTKRRNSQAFPGSDGHHVPPLQTNTTTAAVTVKGLRAEPIPQHDLASQAGNTGSIASGQAQTPDRNCQHTVNQIAQRHLLGQRWSGIAADLRAAKAQQAQRPEAPVNDAALKNALRQAQALFNNQRTKRGDGLDRHGPDMPPQQGPIFAHAGSLVRHRPVPLPISAPAGETIPADLAQDTARRKRPKISQDVKSQVTALREQGSSYPQIALKFPDLTPSQLKNIVSHENERKRMNAASANTAGGV